MKQNISLVSVIVPVYNVERYLSECLESIVNQTYDNLEIICVNDGSSDSSLEILESYSRNDSRFKVITQENRGISAARNVGLQAARGEYILFVDSDDWLDLDTCEKAVQEKADIVFWSYYREYGDRRLETSLYGSSRREWNRESVKGIHRRMIGLTGKELNNPAQMDSVITVWGKLYKSILIKDVAFVDVNELGSCEDMLFNVETFFHVNSVVYLPNIHYHHRKTNQLSYTSGAYKKELVNKWRGLFHRVEDLLDQQHADKTFYKALLNRRALGVIQLGLCINSDSSLTFLQKVRELKSILTSADYRVALKQLSLKNMPIHWRIFFRAARGRRYVALLMILNVMNWLRRKV